MIQQKVATLGILGLLGCSAHVKKTLDLSLKGAITSTEESADSINSLDDLRQAYPNLNFSSGFPSGDKYPSAPINSNTVQTVSNWLQDKPGIERLVQNIHLHRYDGASAGIEYEDGPNDVYFLNNATFSISIGAGAVNPLALTVNPIRDLTSPLQVLDHEFVHVQDNYVAHAENLLINKKRIKRYGTLEQKYAEVAIETTAKLYQDPKFLELLEDVGDIGYPMRIINYVASAEGMVDNYLSADLRRATIIFDIGVGLATSEDERAEELLIRWNTFLEEETGLYFYSFNTFEFNELSATYAELPIERARKNTRLAQLEFDRVMSLDPPKWLEESAKNRYFQIMGGEDGDYCSINECSPCLDYTLTCNPN